MGIYARIQDGIVMELFTPPEGFGIADCFVPELAATFVEVPEGVEVEQGWTFDGTTFAAPVIPPPPPPTADELLAEAISQGIAITCTSNSALNATYALDPTTMEQIGSVARDFSSGLGLPGDIETFTYPDSTGQPRTFTGDQLTALYRKQRNLLTVLNTQAAIMGHGGSPSWPAQTAVIA